LAALSIWGGWEILAMKGRLDNLKQRVVLMFSLHFGELRVDISFYY
jgi:hypothetical protein